MNIEIAELVRSPLVHAIAAYGAIVGLSALPKAAGPLKRLLAAAKARVSELRGEVDPLSGVALDEGSAARRAVLVELRHKAAELAGGDEREAALELMDNVDLLERKLFPPRAVYVMKIQGADAPRSPEAA